MLVLFLSETEPSDIHRQLAHVYPHEVPSKGTFYNWFNRFEKKNYKLEHKARLGQPKELDLDLLKNTVKADSF